jgi:hypothetical protein
MQKEEKKIVGILSWRRLVPSFLVLMDWFALFALILWDIHENMNISAFFHQVVSIFLTRTLRLVFKQIMNPDAFLKCSEGAGECLGIIMILNIVRSVFTFVVYSLFLGPKYLPEVVRYFQKLFH